MFKVIQLVFTFSTVFITMFRTSTCLKTLSQEYSANMKSGQENHMIILTGLTPIFMNWSVNRFDQDDLELLVEV